MANQIASVLRSGALRNELWQNSYREYQHLSWDKASHRINSLYERHLTGVAA
jgi:glycosyltransferase involved in cell wall biosynthesis